MDAKELFNRVLAQASEVFETVTPADYQKPTPDTEWDVHTLANHMLYELSWIPEMVQGYTIVEVGAKYDGDLLENVPAANWHTAAERAIAAVSACDLGETAHLSYGDYSNESYLQQASGDLLVHSWDLASALQTGWHMDPEVAQVIYDGMAASRAAWQNSGLFGREIDVPGSADIQTKLLALTGRNAAWRPQ